MTDLKGIIRENVRRLLRLPEGRSGVSVLMRLGFSNGTATRVLSGETSIGVDLLTELAQRLHVEPWQLCVAGIDRDALPVLGRPPKLSPAALQIAAALDQMDEAGRDVMLKMADALIRPQPGPSAESSTRPTTAQTPVQ